MEERQNKATYSIIDIDYMHFFPNFRYISLATHAENKKCWSPLGIILALSCREAYLSNSLKLINLYYYSNIGISDLYLRGLIALI